MAKMMDRVQRQVMKEKLANFDLLKDLPLAAKEELMSVVEQVHYPKGSVLFYEGESSFDLFLILDGEVTVYKKSPSAEEQEQAQAAPVGRRMSMVRRKSSGLIMDEPAEQQYGQSIGTISSGQAVGVVALMESQPRSATALVSEPGEMLLVRKADFVRLIKEPMSRDWVEKDRFLQDHLVGIREHAKSFVPITGKSHATHMFVKKKYLPGHIFLHEGQMAEGALYVIFEGSVEFFRAASGTTATLREAWKNPVTEQRKPLGLLQPTSAGVIAREYRLCAMLPGGLFSSASFTGGEKTTEEFSVIAGPKGCVVFESVGDNFQKLPLKVVSAAREVLSKVAQVHQERCGVLLATLDSRNEENPAKLWKRTVAWQGSATARRASQSNPLLTSSKMQVGLPQGRRERDGPLTARTSRSS